MKNNIKEFESLFNNIKSMGYVKSLRKGTTGAGYTFETLLGKAEDSLSLPDFKGIEIKTTYAKYRKDIVLFSYAPESNIICENERLLREYGYQKDNTNDIIAFRHNFTSRYNDKNTYKAKLEFDDEFDVLTLKIYDKYTYECIDKGTYWNNERLLNLLETKLNYLAIVKVNKKIIKDEIYYAYYDYSLYKLKNSKLILDLIRQGDVYVQFTMAIKEAEDKRIYVDNHGTHFILKIDAVEKLFEKIKKTI